MRGESGKYCGAAAAIFLVAFMLWKICNEINTQDFMA